MSTRLLGTLAMIAGPLLFVENTCVPLDDPARAWIAGLLGMAYIAGIGCSALGLAWLGATGRGVGSRLAFVVQAVGLLLAAVWSAHFVVVPRPDASALLFRVSDAAWPLSHLFMLVVAVLVLRARVLAGWRRWVPLVCGLALPLGLAARAAAGPEAMGPVFLSLTAAGFTALGYVVRSSRRVPAAAWAPSRRPARADVRMA